MVPVQRVRESGEGLPEGVVCTRRCDMYQREWYAPEVWYAYRQLTEPELQTGPRDKRIDESRELRVLVEGELRRIYSINVARDTENALGRASAVLEYTPG